MKKKKLPDVVADQPFRVKKSGIQGKGGYATRAIAKGERVIEYVGERISYAEADRRYNDEEMQRHHTFLFTVSGRTVIDAAVDGNDARFLNHSCDPNCEAIEERGRIFIYAIKAVRAGDELVYDYAYARDRDTTADDEARYACRCGASNCRGTILAPPKNGKQPPHHAASRHAHDHIPARSGKADDRARRA